MAIRHVIACSSAPQGPVAQAIQAKRAAARTGRRGPNRVRSDDEAYVIELHHGGATYDQIQEATGYGKKAVRGLIKRRGLPQRGVGGIALPVQHDCFASIDTEAKAYWLGMMTADGCVTDEGRVELCLASKDREHVEEFRRHIGATHQVGVYPVHGPIGKGLLMSASVRVRSKQMAADLARHGVVPRKSLIVRPWQGPPELMRHYWRGVVDGDGWLYRAKDRIWHIGLVGSRFVVEAFATYAVSLAPTRSKSRQVGSIWSIEIGGTSTAVPVIRTLYSGATMALTRKACRAAQCMAD